MDRCRRTVGWVWLWSMLVYAQTGSAFEVGTHERLTGEAFDRSVLNELTTGPLDALHIGDVGRRIFRSLPPRNLESKLASVKELVGLGARYEDEPTPGWVWPPVVASEIRFLRHFYDPQQNGIGLNVPWMPTAHSSLRWMLEDAEDIPEQALSLKDALEFHFQALASQTSEARRENLILLLQAIGAAVHHIQDMAQPAHTRNDPHVPLEDIFELHTERQFVGLRRPLPSDRPYGEDGLDLRDFDTARKFWSNDGKGIAEFTSRNFVSKSTNFTMALAGAITDPRHPLPAWPTAPAVERRTAGELGIPGVPQNAVLDFVGTDVTDRYSETTTFNPRATTYSIFSPDLAVRGYESAFTLNRFTFEENYRLLFPRAIAYSTALIDYFFRGRLALESFSMDGATVSVTVRNDSAAQFALADSAHAGAEEFSIYYDAADGRRRRLALSNDDLAGQLLEHEATRTFSFSRPPDLDRSADRPFVLVFRGTAGNEEGIAALRFGPSPAAFVVTPSYLPADGLAGPRVIRWNGNGWELTQELGKVAGNVDWRARDGRVVTWDGPQSRYFFGPLQREGISRNVYMNGAVLTRAPANVIGAAIREQPHRDDLIVVVYAAGELQLFVRPLQSSYPNDDEYSTSNPTGWRLIHSSAQQPPATPMFFNDTGTEGQLMTSHFAARYRLRISANRIEEELLPARGKYEDVLVETTHATPTLQLTYGTLDRTGCGAIPVCLEQTQCLRPGATQPTQVCVERRKDVTSSRNETQHLFSRVTWSRPTVVCVDYRGSTEVLCEIGIDPPRDERADGSSAYSDWSHGVLQGDCSEAVTGLKSIRQSGRVTRNNSTGRALKVGRIEVPLSGQRTRTDGTSQFSWDRAVGAAATNSGTAAYDYSRTTYNTRILYLDARNDIAVYMAGDAIERFGMTQQGSDIPLTAQGSQSWYALTGQVTDTLWRRDRVVEVLGARERVLRDRETLLASQPPRPVGYTVYQRNSSLSGDGMAPPDCQSPGYVRETPGTATQDPFLFSTASVHPLLLSGSPAQGIGFSSAGALIAVPMWSDTSEATSASGTHTYLDGGDLRQLIPGGSDSAAYWPIGVLE